MPDEAYQERKMKQPSVELTRDEEFLADLASQHEAQFVAMLAAARLTVAEVQAVRWIQ